MNIRLNGEEYATDASTVGALLSALEIKPGRVAVEVNLVIVKKAEYDTHPINEGDQVEVINFVGGGSAVCTHSADRSCAGNLSEKESTWKTD